jgi:hypothetical protein
MLWKVITGFRTRYVRSFIEFINLSCHFYTYQRICTVHYYGMFKFNLHKLIYTNFANCNNYMKKSIKKVSYLFKIFQLPVMSTHSGEVKE